MDTVALDGITRSSILGGIDLLISVLIRVALLLVHLPSG
jgi:hypothetical protein